MGIESQSQVHRSIDPAAADAIFQTLSARWVLHILVALSKDDLRFTCLRREIPRISANVLTVRLRELEAACLVSRTTSPPPDSYQLYGLGPLAHGLRPALQHLEQWRIQLGVFGKT